MFMVTNVLPALRRCKSVRSRCSRWELSLAAIPSRVLSIHLPLLTALLYFILHLDPQPTAINLAALNKLAMFSALNFFAVNLRASIG